MWRAPVGWGKHDACYEQYSFRYIYHAHLFIVAHSPFVCLFVCLFFKHDCVDLVLV